VSTSNRNADNGTAVLQMVGGKTKFGSMEEDPDDDDFEVEFSCTATPTLFYQNDDKRHICLTST